MSQRRKGLPRDTIPEKQETVNGTPKTNGSANGNHARSEKGKTASSVSQIPQAAVIAASVLDYSLMVSLVFGGCCSNVWAYEQLLRIEPRIGSALTFSQMLFITIQQLPSHLTWTPWPRLKPRQVPLSRWMLQVVMLASGSLLNNWVYAFEVPLTVQIVFRSAGLAVSMLFGRVLLKKRYSAPQIIAVALVSVGVIIATLSRPSSTVSSASTENLSQYALGIIMLTASLFLTGILGLLQEQTYQKYGPCWREGVFYTVKYGLTSLGAASGAIPIPYLVLGANLLSQLVCVSGVNQLTSSVSSVSTQVVLTTRKAISLLFSVWWFGNGWNAQLGLGAGMVFAGSFWYSRVSADAKSVSTSASDTPASSPDVRASAKYRPEKRL
ncbi:hypothetical protein EWM64_g711 [Hericium alpestre]|uniref:Sugar phosphate transporter domain-containing protein n=1 Tax=Hericium alpestre TaxID=135208 RepID=A0A4Z0AAG2_9AGAM|nr:hypothetical protein EWM64_g711 [Hericium alpestre]